MNIQKCRSLYQILAGTGLALILLGGLLSQVSEGLFSTLLFLGFLVLCLAITMGWKHYRCPECRRPLSLRDGIPTFCPGCGERLSDSGTDQP